MEGYDYPKKPESEYGFEEFKLTGKRIEELREALRSLATHNSENEPAEVDLDSAGISPDQNQTRVEMMREELREKIARYNTLKERLATESNPPE